MADQAGVCRALRGKGRADFCDSLIAVLAERQHGVVSRGQLEEYGVSRYAIERRIRRRTLHALHRGVFAVGHRSLTAEGRWLAAVLASGSGAALSHRSAGALWGLVRSSLLEVTAPGWRRRPRIKIYEAELPPDEITTHRGVPITIVPRTLLDLATVLPRIQLERAMNEAEVRRLYDSLSSPDLLERYPGRPGTPMIRAILDQPGFRVTRSGLEERFVAFIDERRLPRPEINAWLQAGGTWLECDCVLRAQRLVVELDGHAFHGTRAAFDADRARDRRLHAAGWRVARITWHRLQDDAQALARDLRTILDRAAL